MSCSRQLVTSFLSSPLGKLELITCSQGIHQLQIVGVTCDDDFTPNPGVAVDLQDKTKAPSIVASCIKWLDIYFNDKSKARNQELPPICHFLEPGNKSPFTSTVWQTLATKVHFGTTVSYGQLAERSGSSSKASRAVGSAMKNNPVSIIVPCHRVIQSSGRLGNYSGGKKNSVKVWLLEHERALKQG